MTLIAAIAIACLTTAGVSLLLERDLLRVVAGTVPLTHGVIVFTLASSFGWGSAPVELVPGESVTDPLPQALALTAVVISFGTTALLLGVMLATERAHRSMDAKQLARAEIEEERAEEPEEG